mmetsp:Transcript_20709/g.45468  ORF Transcript_20709/g.45468 Transcript_20709/m.45468 type:complete len:215 (+) Transcript_20709:209-853(+)
MQVHRSADRYSFSPISAFGSEQYPIALNRAAMGVATGSGRRDDDRFHLQIQELRLGSLQWSGTEYRLHFGAAACGRRDCTEGRPLRTRGEAPAAHERLQRAAHPIRVSGLWRQGGDAAIGQRTRSARPQMLHLGVARLERGYSRQLCPCPVQARRAVRGVRGFLVSDGGAHCKGGVFGRGLQGGGRKAPAVRCGCRTRGHLRSPCCPKTPGLCQ